jgi:manganese/zinc/iron transport system substrate-binding protein
MFKFSVLLIFSLCFLFLLFSCTSKEGSSHTSQEWMKPNGKVKALSTIAMIDDLVRQVGGEYVDSISLIRDGLDPHSYQLVKGDNEKLVFADLIFYNGLGLEHGPSLQTYLRKNAKAIPLGDQLMKENPALILHYQDQLDPHIWMDVSLWTKTLPYIVQALSAKDPAHADVYRQRAAALEIELKALHQEIKNEMLAIPESQRYLVTSHDAFNYFTRAYLAENNEKTQAQWQRRFAAPEGLAPDSQLSTTDIQSIIDYLHQNHIHVLFPESNVSRDSINKIVNAGKSKGLELKIAQEPLYADAMGVPGSDGDTYIKMIRHNSKTIASYLRNNHP